MRAKFLTVLGIGLGTSLCLGQIELVSNGSMELGDGPNGIDQQVAASWTEFGINVERSSTVNYAPPGSGHALKAFGDGSSTTAGAEQIKSGVAPGASVSVSGRMYTPSFDKVGGDGVARIELEFLNLFNGLINPPATVQSAVVLDASTAADTWISASIGPVVAPAGTSKVRVRCRLSFSANGMSGACYWDDVQLTINGGANQAVNGDFETAGNSPGQSAYGITDWLGFNDQEKSNLAARTGTYSCQIGTREGYNGLYQDLGPVVAGERLVLSGYVWNPSTDPLTGNSRAGMKLEFASNGQTPPPEENLSFTPAATQDVWTNVSLSTTVPNDVTIARIVVIYGGAGGSSGAAYVDAVSATRNGGANQLTNSSFEASTGGVPDDWTHFNAAGQSECLGTCFNGFELDGDCMVRATGTSFAGLYQNITVAPGETLTITAPMYNWSVEPLAGSQTKAGVKVEWFFGGIPGAVDIGPPGDGHTIGAGAATNTWIPISIDYTLPAGTNCIARIVLITEKSTGLTGKVYFDDCSALVYGRCQPCDTNCDGSVNPFDINGFLSVLSGGTPCSACSGDANNDGTTNPFDINAFLVCLGG